LSLYSGLTVVLKLMIPKIVSNIVVNKRHVLTTNDWGTSRTFSNDWVVQLHWKSFNVNPVTVGIVQVDYLHVVSQAQNKTKKKKL